ncbi:MAG: hypothetical protein J6T84_08855 [Spirochaetaceae bacterium]|nr:hypothetical protein [Spirochaetaceae bacterium]
MNFDNVTDFNIDDSENQMIPPDSPFLAKKADAAYDKNDIDIQDFSEDMLSDLSEKIAIKTNTDEQIKDPEDEAQEIDFSNEEEIDLGDFLSDSSTEDVTAQSEVPVSDFMSGGDEDVTAQFDVPVSDFMTGGDEDVTAQFDVPVSDFMVSGGEDITDDFLSELNSEFSGSPSKEDKTEYMYDAPVDIELTFDDSFVDEIKTESYEHVIDETNAFADVTITDANGVEDNFDDFFNSPSQIQTPAAETKTQETASFDVVNEFDDFLTSDAQEAPLSDIVGGERKITKIVDYNITVKEDDSASAQPLATEDTNSDLDVNESIPLFTSEEERKQQLARYIKKTDTANIETASSSIDDFDVDALLAEVEVSSDITGSITETEIPRDDTSKEIPSLDDLDGIEPTIPEMDDMEIVNDSQTPQEPADDIIDFDIPIEDESVKAFDEALVSDENQNAFFEPEVSDDINENFNALNDNKKLDITKNSEYNVNELDEEEPMNFDDITQTPQEDEKLNAFSETEGAASSSSDTSSVLKEISSELNQLRSELASLKAEFSAFRNGQTTSAAVEEPAAAEQVGPEEAEEEPIDLKMEPLEEPEAEAVEAPASGSTGFFDDDAEDDTIALSGDELTNILNNADFTEEYVDNTQEEPADSELPGSVTEIDQNEEPVAEETDGMNLSADIDFDEKLEEPELDDVAISDDLDATIEDDISIPKVDDILEPPAEDDIVGEETPVTTDSLSSDNIDYLESEPASDEMPEKSMDIPDDFGMEEEPQDIVLEEPEQEEPVPTVESVTNDIPSEEADFTEPEISDADFADDEPLPLAPEDLPADADEEAEANEPTDKVFESDQWNEPETAPVEEEPEFVPAEEPAPAADESHSVLEKANQIKGTMTSDLRDEIKSVLIYMDQLLENLPEDKIEEFAKSEYFETYKKLFKELGLS